MLSAVIAIALATGVTLSVLALGMAGYNTLLLRDAVVEASNRASRAEAPKQLPYLLRRIETELPHLAGYEIDELARDGKVGFKVRASSPGLGFFGGGEVHAEALATSEDLG